MTDDLTKEVITHKEMGEHVYDQPYSARSLLGLLGYINDFTERDIETTHVSVSPKVGNLNIFINCKKESVETIYANPIPANKVELSFFQNLLDNLGMPNELYFDLGRIKEFKKKHKIPDEADAHLPMLEGTKARFVKDP